mgnify:CR=1 FL=1
MNDKSLELFNRRAIRTKRDLLAAVDDYIERLQKDEDIKIVRLGRAKALAELISTFCDKIEKTPLANLNTPFCAYEVDIVDTEVKLNISEYYEITFDDDGEMNEASSTVTPDIIVATAPYIPIHQFADMQGVKIGTVRQWIRRGKIRNVKKVGSEWLIASTEGKPCRGFNGGTYYCVDEDGDISKLLPLKEGTHSIELWKVDPYCEECLATLSDCEGQKIDEIKLNRAAREKLEHALAASENIKFQSTFIDSITEKVKSVDFFDSLYSKDAVFDFMKTVDLRETYKEMINAIASSSSVDEALASVFKQLGLTQKFEDYSKSKSGTS